MAELKDFLLSQASGDLLPWEGQMKAADAFSLTIAEIEEAALNFNLLPARYQRNRQTISIAQQLRLLKSKVAVIGCGGLGGYVLEIMARLGVGTIKAIDPDVFVEHNLNRQLFCTFSTLGHPKAEVAKRRVKEINPAVRCMAIQKMLNRSNGAELLGDMDVAVDALDNRTSRIDLAEICKELAIPLVHGAIGGWYGQMTTQKPGTDTIKKIYGGFEGDQGIEQALGNPSFTPAALAALQAAEVSKILLQEGAILYNRMLFINLLDMEMDINEI
jgi:molybdopterin-synthase adenylyltransferase